jgi:acyl-CoA dehydrogenase
VFEFISVDDFDTDELRAFKVRPVNSKAQ